MHSTADELAQRRTEKAKTPVDQASSPRGQTYITRREIPFILPSRRTEIPTAKANAFCIVGANRALLPVKLTASFKADDIQTDFRALSRAQDFAVLVLRMTSSANNFHRIVTKGSSVSQLNSNRFQTDQQ